jgi:hypothetical protein
MVREKRKTRLDKGESGEFIGFAAFASPASASGSTTDSASGPSLTLSPIYTGSDSSLGLLFPRIGQKRDATTKTKALGDLRDYFADDAKPKKEQVDALSHLCYLYHSKLHYDNTARVRASCLECFLQASKRLPKAWKTLSEEQQPEIVGMIMCSRADPAADVRLAANELVESLLSTNTNVSEGTWEYVKRILCYGKSKAMHEDLFQKKDNASELSEKHKEELEELYERIVGTAIGGMQFYVQQNYSSDSFDASEDVRFLWKALTSPKPSLRRKTFALMATAYQKAPALIDKDKTSKLLLQSLSSEKEPLNIPYLLETLISFVASLPQEQRSATMALYTKPLTKLFKKGCFGATQWAPTVLPIVAILPQEEQPLILTCVWEGRANVPGLAEELEIVGAVAETATFLLLKSHHDFSEVIAKCWLQSVHTYLTTHGTGPAQRSLQKLCDTLARDWNQLNQASHEKPSSAIFQLKEWFWDEEFPKVILQDSVDNQQLLTLLAQLESKDQDTPNQWAPIMKQKFHKLLATCQGSSGLVPSSDVYELWIAILKRLSVDRVFDKPKLDEFVMNDLLRWMVIHTSSVSDQASDSLARSDFFLFRLCQSLANTGVWNSILREVIAAKCDLEYLEAGLVAMLENGGIIENARSPILDEFCVQVAKEAVEPEGHHIDGTDASELQYEYQKKTASFLQTCAGLGDYESVVQDDTIEAWVDCACPEEMLVPTATNPVLETLVLLAKADRLEKTSVQKVLIQSWRQGGELWQDAVVPWVMEKDDLDVSLVDLASKEVKELLNHVSLESRVDDELSQMWSERANRLLRLCRGDSRCHLPKPSLSLIGMSDSILWKKNEGKGSNSFLAQCLLKLLSQIDDGDDRKALFSNFQSDALELFVNLLLSLSGADTDLVRADLARRRNDTCAILLREVDARSIESSQVDDWCKACISSLSSLLKDGSEERICRGVSVLSQLVELRFRGIRPADSSNDEKCKLEQLKKGATVWYITNSDDPSIREECIIIQNHSDSSSEVYFTIKIMRDGVAQERQTLGERLRNGPFNKNREESQLVSIKDISSEETSQRQILAKAILDELILPHWDKWSPRSFELLSVIIAQCGLLGARGVGSDRHMVLQKFMKMQVQLLVNFDDPGSNKKDIVSSLQVLSFALGYGCNIPASSSQALIGFSPDSSVKAVVSFYDNMENEPDTKLDFAVALWLTVSAASVEDGVLRTQAFSLLFRLSAQLLESSKESERFDSDQYVALRSIQAAQKESHKFKSGESVLEDSEAEALACLTKAFACQWELENTLDPTSPPVWRSLPNFEAVFEPSLMHRRPLMARAARPCMDQLIESLYADSKRVCSTKLLFAYANEGVPLHSEPGGLNDTTADRLEKWRVELIEEECEELEDDVDAVAQWIPQKLMNAVESWYDADGDFITDANNAYGRFLSWIVFCQVAKIAAGKDSTIRPSFASYVTKCKAVDAILNLAVAYGNVGTERKVKLEKAIDIDEILESDEEMQLSKLAAFAIFSTIEVFPTIAKNWWEMVCPNYATQAIREFVQSNVSPEILRRELDRIKQTTAFGAMNVKGSLMSREVTAAYVQDEFTLSVVIKMPLSFPFRRAEVDCSKTYGIPESRWKRWSLQITQMLNNQGGTLSDALLLWKENVDKEFEGVEPCPVCYSVLHVKTHKLPRVECNTCHNRFHIDCLSQWFRSSGKNDCVICQQPWSGARV